MRRVYEAVFRHQEGHEATLQVVSSELPAAMSDALHLADEVLGAGGWRITSIGETGELLFDSEDG